MNKKIRVVMAKPGLDGHDRGIKILARAFRDSGMEVIYLGLRQTPEMIVNAALQEDADVIALSILSGAHMTIFSEVKKLMNEKKLTDVLLTGGGIIPDEDMNELYGDNKYKCDSCDTLTNANKTINMDRSAHILLISVNRHIYNKWKESSTQRPTMTSPMP